MRPALVRGIVFDVFTRSHDAKELADRALDRALRANPGLHSTERRLVSEAFFAMIRHVRRLDFQLSAGLAAYRLPRLDQFATPDLHRLRLAVALATELAHPPAEAARFAGCDEKFVPAVVFASSADLRWPTDPAERLALRRSVPDWVAKRLVAEYGAAADALMAASNERAPLTVRTNLLKGSREALVEKLAQEKVVARAGALSPWALALDGRPNVPSLAAWRAGLFEVQDEGSQLIALATGALPGQTVVDACAGGGGKTLALAAMMQNKGRLVACDVHDGRLKDLAPRSKRAGVFCVQPLVVDAGAPGDAVLKPLAGRADVVLVDAPCSGTGAWRRNPDARWRLTPAEVEQFPVTQLAILRRFARLVKPGGAMVYATCSLLRAENADVVAAFLENKAFTLERAPVPAAAQDDAGHLRVLPHVHGTDGFFGAVLRRAP